MAEKKEKKVKQNGKMKYNPYIAGQQLYVCFQRSGIRGHRA